MPNPLLRTKAIAQILSEGESRNGSLKRCLSGFDLMALGVGAIIGTGIFVLTGVAAAEKAGPAIMLSYTFAGIACIFAALCYAEFAARIPVAGSAYTYAYASIGELLAWIIGWDLILEYTIGSATVARGWSGYFMKFLEGFGIHPPQWLVHIPLGPLDLNLMAALIVALMSVLLAIGIKESARFNAVMVAIKLAVVLFVIFAGMNYVNPGNWTPFTPYGVHGIFAGAATIFFAYIGFDAVSTAAEETRNPKRDLPIGIIGSLVFCTLLYVAVSAVITGMVPYNKIDLTAPLAVAFGDRGLVWAQTLISTGAFAGLTTVVLVLLMSQPRIYLSMSRDGLLPQWFARIHPRFGTPINATLLTGLIAGSMAFLVDISHLAEMVAIGTLFAFAIVCGSVMVLRFRSAEKPREGGMLVGILTLGFIILSIGITLETHMPSLAGLAVPLMAVGGILALVAAVKLFRQKSVNIPETFVTPWVPLIPILGIGANVYMMFNLPPETWLRLVVWLVIGLAIYFGYGVRHSRLAAKDKQ